MPKKKIAELTPYAKSILRHARDMAVTKKSISDTYKGSGKKVIKPKPVTPMRKAKGPEMKMPGKKKAEYPIKGTRFY